MCNWSKQSYTKGYVFKYEYNFLGKVIFSVNIMCHNHIVT